MAPALRYVFVAVLSAAVALAASHFARTVMPAHHGSELHQLMHDRLDLTAQQEAQIDQLEADFSNRRKALDAQLRQSNIALAKAIEAEQQIGPKVGAAVDASHMAMGELQKATLAHVFAMRAVLTPSQQAIFDREIARALTVPNDT
ncbi:MAG: heavy metal resistance protein [Novosphingobium sp. 28-62-57]|uniref:Spy/CpxP family protein refolding chaperone n=1 Tax=unclassified Novosphingobium TaxID=2644732 RepID=UPI000BC55B31|nr:MULTISPECIES: periplasmic heavy metal sensor [unclassified Novosphingobium]OYW48619.1 MAG: heavy metal resistance protein [Novosphingobium sp. 12-62-10]OYZ10172.1 MAG: heavy metal resistance protein [Novosphingobium sp. 28-62-57]OZA33591.1 MAG: heavy metal resistance protein [Novosphingobium sp. 17-62-9]HQS70364.1 periplasmic heavy metal sensor [Novosphingobium sp.]